MGRKSRILILEDLPTDAELVVDELKRANINFTYVLVETEAEFRKALKKFKPDIVLSDYSLPTINGMEAIQIVTKEYPHIPVIIVTGSINEETAVACMKAGAADYVLKEKLKRVGTAVQITIKNLQIQKEKEEIEARLKSTEESLHLSFNNAAIGMVQVSLDGKFTRVNKAFEKIAGYSELELLKITFQDITYPEDYAIGAEIVKQIISGKKSTGIIEKRYLHKNGKIINVRLNTALIRDEHGNPKHFFTQVEDITAPKEANLKLDQAREETRKAQEIFKHAIENASGVPYLLNLETGDYEFVGDGIENLLGIKPLALNREKMKKAVLEVIITDSLNTAGLDAVEYAQKFNQNQVESYKADFRVNLGIGTEKWVSDSSLPIKNDKGKVTHSLGILMDITDRKNAEINLAEREKYYRALLNQLHEDVIVIGKDYKITDMNNSFLQTTHHKRDEIIGRHCYEISHGYNKPCDEMGEICTLKDVFKTGLPSQCLHEHHQADGATAWVDILLSPLMDNNGKTTHVIESARNVTDLLLAKEEVQKLSVAIEQSPVSVVITDLKGAIEYVNPKFCSITGYTRQEALGKNPNILKSGEQSDEVYKDLWATISKGKIWNGEFHNMKKNGELFWEEATIGPIKDTHGNVTHFIAIKEDVTAQRKLEEQFRQSQKLEAIGQLAGGVAHDFNNLLTVINGYSQLMLEDLKEGDRFYKDVQQIAKAGDKAGNLTQQLLAFSRKQVIKLKTLNLNSIIKDTEKMLGRLIGENIELTLKLADNLAPIKADKGQMDQILLNLCVNARDAMPEGGRITIESKNITINGDYYKHEIDAKPGDYIMMAVSDTGVGMPADVKNRIFEPFFTTKETGQGTGLGLATVYGIIKQNKGYIWVYSEPGLGTTFKIYLPAVKEKGLKKDQKSTDKTDFRGTETILVVEDEFDVRELTCDILRSQGYNIIEAANGLEALELVKKTSDSIHLLLADVIMPKMSGKNLADQMLIKLPDIKVIFFSGYTDDTISKSGILEDGMMFLQKPFAPNTLLEMVRCALDDKAE